MPPPGQTGKKHLTRNQKAFTRLLGLFSPQSTEHSAVNLTASSPAQQGLPRPKDPGHKITGQKLAR